MGEPLEIGSVADWIAVVFAAVALMTAGGAGSRVLQQREARRNRLTVAAKAVKGATNFMRVEIRYEGDDSSSAVRMLVTGTTARFIGSETPKLDTGEIDHAAINRTASHTMLGTLGNSGAPGSREFTGRIHAIWPAGSVTPITFTFEQPQGRRRYSRTISVSPTP